MSAETIDEIIGVLIIDAEFRQQLLRAPEQALEGYDLSDEERRALSGLGGGLRRRHGSSRRATVQGRLSSRGFDSPELRDANAGH